MSITEDLHKFANFKTFNEAKKKEVKKEEEDGDTKKDHPVLKKIKQKLDIKDKEIQEIYKDDPKKLANDLAKAVGDEQEATGLLAYMANVLGSNEKDIFDKALSAMKEIDPDGDDKVKKEESKKSKKEEKEEDSEDNNKNEEDEEEDKEEEKEEASKKESKSKKESVQLLMAQAVEKVFKNKESALWK